MSIMNTILTANKLFFNWKEVVFYCDLADYGHNKECAVFPELNIMQSGCQEYTYGCTLTCPV